MTKENLSEGVILYHGDALGILYSLPDLVMDAVLTDPPYSSGGVTLGARQADPAHKYQQSGTKRQYPPMLGDTKDQRSWTMWCTLWLTECWRIARDGAPLLVFTDWRQLPSLSDAVQAAGWKWLGIVPWDNLWLMVCWQILVKTLYEIVVLPVTKRVVRYVKRTEGVDVYDRGISYNILKVS